MRRDGLATRRPSRRVGGTLSPLEQAILAFGPAQWIRFTSANLAPNSPGGPIAAAADLSQYARDVSQGVSTRQPTFSNPGANFDGTDDGLGGVEAYLNNVESFSVFTVVDLRGAVLANTTEPWGYDTGDCLLDFGDGGKPRAVIKPGGVAILPSGPSVLSGASGRHLIDARLVNGASRLWDNGVGGTNVTTAWSGSTIPCAVAPAVGAGLANGFRSFPGTIFDVIVFTPALSLTGQATVRSLLAQLDEVTL